ncbi:Cys-Gln thioester bond-forming surface protein [Stackebrandtia soli]|uniref:Cys-Gln thioester bond-forming surface protein n=1 Tax=Stackebrandtia soli TaxID=1892856 RepID=UPI0039EB9E52
MNNNWMRAGVAAAAAGVLALGMAGTATAEDDIPAPTRGSVVVEPGWIANGTEDAERVGRIFLKPEGSETLLPTYCIDLMTPLDSSHMYESGEWTESNVANLALVQWVLHNGYPTADPAALAEAAGADLTDIPDVNGVAYTATQTAVWHFTDGFNLNVDDATDEHAAVDAAVAAIYTYLTENAAEMPEPVSDIIFDGPSTGDVTEKIGPFTVTTPGGDVELTIDGGKLVDADDNEITSLPNGGEFYINPDDGVENITVKAKGQIAQPTGSVFMTTDQPAEGFSTLSKDDSQKLILGTSLEGETEAEMTLEVSGGDNTLPVTGMSLTTSIILGAVILAAGGALLVVMRRRRVAATWGDAA